MRAPRSALLSILLGMALALPAATQAVAQEATLQTVDVVAQNRTDYQVRVYALQKGHMVPLQGLVPERGSATLSLPAYFAGSEEAIQLVADLIGSDDVYKSEPMTVRGRDAIEFVIDESTFVGTDENETDRVGLSEEGPQARARAPQ